MLFWLFSCFAAAAAYIQNKIIPLAGAFATFAHANKTFNKKIQHRKKESAKEAKIIYRFASFVTMIFRAKRIFRMRGTLHDTKRTLAPIFINVLAY